jgi:hypothetical protein
MAVPIIDVSQFLHGTENAKLASSKQLATCLNEYGVVRLTGYGLSSSAISGLFDWVRGLYLVDLPR